MCAENSPAHLKLEFSDASRNAQADIYIQVTTLKLMDIVENTIVSSTTEFQ